MTRLQSLALAILPGISFGAMAQLVKVVGGKEQVVATVPPIGAK